MKNIIMTTSIALASFTLYGQGGVAINTTGDNPTPSAMLDVESNSKGILIPRVALSGSTDVTTIANGNITSLLVYNTNTISDISPGYYYWNGTIWKNLGGDADADPTNEIELPIGGVNGQVLSTDGSGNYTWINDNMGSDSQNIQNLAFDNTSNILTVGIQNGSSQTIDLSLLINDADADVNNEIQNLSLTANKLALTLSNDSIDLSSFVNHNWYKENTMTQATSISESIYTRGRIGIGKINPQFNVDSDSTINTDGSYAQLGKVILTSAPNLSSQSDFNVGIGLNSLSNITNGKGNIGLGSNTLYFNTTGSFNTAVGHYSLNRNLSGTRNTSMGNLSMYRNTIGSFNTAFGNFSLLENTSGSNNTALGSRSLFSNSTGYHNTSIGQGSLERNTSGYRNISIGSRSMAKNNLGYSNVAVGFKSLFNNKNSQQNTAIGDYSLAFHEGSNNTAVGCSSFSKFIADINNTYSFNVTSNTYSNSILTHIFLNNHGLPLNNPITVQVSSTNTLFNGMNNGQTIEITPFHVDSIELNFLVTSPGSGTITFAQYDNSLTITNSTSIGFNSQPTRSNQIMLGDQNVTEVKTYGSFISGTTTYPDYVFEQYYEGVSEIKESYQFLTLNEVENYIKKNKHLPGVKSINDISKENGRLEINMTETTVLNLEKIEELFLYVIDLNKQMVEKNNQIEILIKEVQLLKQK